jgi:hypothetical protein
VFPNTTNYNFFLWCWGHIIHIRPNLIFESDEKKPSPGAEGIRDDEKAKKKKR